MSDAAGIEPQTLDLGSNALTPRPCAPLVRLCAVVYLSCVDAMSNAHYDSVQIWEAVVYLTVLKHFDCIYLVVFSFIVSYNIHIYFSYISSKTKFQDGPRQCLWIASLTNFGILQFTVYMLNTMSI